MNLFSLIKICEIVSHKRAIEKSSQENLKLIKTTLPNKIENPGSLIKVCTTVRTLCN